jgi:hypothetical protein
MNLQCGRIFYFISFVSNSYVNNLIGMLFSMQYKDAAKMYSTVCRLGLKRTSKK